MNWMILVFGVFANAFASVLIKLAVTPPRAPPSLDNIMSVITNWHLISGLLMYGIAFLLYIIALSKFPLNVAHPILTIGAVAIVTLLSFIIFKEPLEWTRLAGIILVIVGALLIMMTAS